MAEILDVTEQAYHADAIADTPTLSRSIAQLICSRSPAHARAAHPRLAETPPADVTAKHFDVGSAVHVLLLEPEKSLLVRVEAKDWKTKAAQEARAQARSLGLIPLLEHEADRVEACVASVRSQMAEWNPVPAFLSGAIEKTIVWERDGVLCRARPDSILPEVVDDLKTATSALPARWTRTIPDHGYDIQAAMYLDAVQAVHGTRSQALWRWIIVEPFPPFAMSVVYPGADVLEVGRAKFNYALKWWRECLKSGKWPSYPREMVEAELPPWADEARFLVDLP